MTDNAELFRKEAEKAVMPFIADFNGRLSLKCSICGTSLAYSYRADEIHHAASMIKLPVMGSLFEAAKEGLVSLDDMAALGEGDIVEGGVLYEMHPGTELTLRDLARLMIVVSDNTAMNILADRLGFGAISEHIKRLGMDNTGLVKKLMLPPPVPGAYNYTTAGDIWKFLSMLESGEIAGREECDEMISIMSRQMFIEKIPRRLPKGVFTANKTGEVSGVRHDGAIIRAFGKAMIISVLTSDSSDENASDDVISDISASLFRVFERFCKRD